MVIFHSFLYVYQRVVNLGPTVKVVALCESIGARSKRGGAATQRDGGFGGRWNGA